MNERSSILDSVHAVESTLKTDSERGCESPLCSVRFAQTGMEISPKRFCCGECRQQASLIRRVAKLYGLPIETVHEVLTKARAGR
jgi:hypothetical protein